MKKQTEGILDIVIAVIVVIILLFAAFGCTKPADASFEMDVSKAENEGHSRNY